MTRLRQAGRADKSGRQLVLRTILPCIVMALVTGPLLLADEIPEYRLKAEFIERLTRFIEWPAESLLMKSSDAPFIIGIVGEDPFGSYLDRLAKSRKIKGRSIEVRQVALDRDLLACSLLFISESERDHVEPILDLTHDRPILTVGDTTSFAQRGVIINFFTADERVQFEINEETAAASGLEIRAKLYKLARIVSSGDRPDGTGPPAPETHRTTDLLPIITEPPVYPRHAVEREIEGWVILEFTVTATGEVRDPRVVESQPSSIFDNAAIRAALKFRYKPRIVDGEPTSVTGVLHKITFRLED